MSELMPEKLLCELSKAELIAKILRINPVETEKHLKHLPKKILIAHIENYRRYNAGITE